MKIINETDLLDVEEKWPQLEISSDDVVVTHVDEIWDGPLSGACTWGEEIYYFFAIDQISGDTHPWPAKYVLIKLNDLQRESFEITQRAYKNWYSKNLSNDDYVKILSDAIPWTINPSQIVAWFVISPGAKSKFIESYFRWKDASNGMKYSDGKKATA